ncbi:MAG: transposase [Kordiimonadaceae bacterium]|nr:transposase [Kordiimonadaceae bacterium]
MAGKRQRGKWRKSFRRQIVAEAEASDGPMSDVARRHGVNPKVSYNCRQQLAASLVQGVAGLEVCLVPVEVEALPVVKSKNSSTSGADCLEITVP